jgi:hypothetical protein
MVINRAATASVSADFGSLFIDQSERMGVKNQLPQHGHIALTSASHGCVYVIGAAGSIDRMDTRGGNRFLRLNARRWFRYPGGAAEPHSLQAQVEVRLLKPVFDRGHKARRIGPVHDSMVVADRQELH